MIFEISNKHNTVGEVMEVVLHRKRISIGQDAITSIEQGRTFLDQEIVKSNSPVYGVNTGFGALYKKKISKKNLKKLQENLVKSHACGTGDEMQADIIRLMLVLKIKSLSFGNSAVKLETVQRLVDFYNNDILPVIYSQGSLGASGDLAPLAHMCLPLIGLGEARIAGKKMSGLSALRKFKLKQVELSSKEGLALLNGTQFMQACGIIAIHHAHRLCRIADLVTALSLEAFDGRIEAFDENVHKVRPHIGQIKSAQRIREALNGSKIIFRPKPHVQDPYSFRCAPQVHGASIDTVNYCMQVFETELNSVTDNPMVFPEENLLLSGGNFHGQPLALASDFLAIALAELGNISERRTYQLINGLRGLPPFLVANPGLNSGFMIPQYTAASIVSQNKQYCTPASVDSITSSAGQEDHVSMGANAGIKCLKVVENIYAVLAIELLTAAQALDFRNKELASEFNKALHEKFRETVDFTKEDTVLYKQIEQSIYFIKTHALFN